MNHALIDGTFKRSCTQIWTVTTVKQYLSGRLINFNGEALLDLKQSRLLCNDLIENFRHLRTAQWMDETIDDFLEGFPTVGRDKVIAIFEAAERHASLLAG